MKLWKIKMVLNQVREQHLYQDYYIKCRVKPVGSGRESI